MKTVFIFDKLIGIAAALFLFNISMHSQSLDRMVVATGGQNASTSNGSLAYTIGETIVTSLNTGPELSPGFHQEWAVITAVQNDFADQYNIKIYPNPTTGWLNITSGINAHLILFDLSGKIVFQGEKQVGTENINLGNLPAGIYMLVLKNDRGDLATYKVQVVN